MLNNLKCLSCARQEDCVSDQDQAEYCIPRDHELYEEEENEED